MSGWIGQVDKHGQPKHAVTVIYIFSAAMLCTILPSQVAFTSLISAANVPAIAAYGLIALLRLIMTPDSFKSSYFFLGRYRRIYYFVTALFNGLLVAVRDQTKTLYSHRIIAHSFLLRSRFPRSFSLLLLPLSTLSARLSFLCL